MLQGLPVEALLNPEQMVGKKGRGKLSKYRNAPSGRTFDTPSHLAVSSKENSEDIKKTLKRKATRGQNMSSARAPPHEQWMVQQKSEKP